MRANVKHVVNIKSVKYKVKYKQCVGPINQRMDPNVDPNRCFDNRAWTPTQCAQRAR